MKCPSCDSAFRNRKRRRLLDRLMPKSKRYICLNCKKEYLGVTFFKNDLSF